MSGDRFEPGTSRIVTRKNAEQFDGDTGLEFIDFRVESRTEVSQRVLVTYLT
jgi:hypothetical protein